MELPLCHTRIYFFPNALIFPFTLYVSYCMHCTSQESGNRDLIHRCPAPLQSFIPVQSGSKYTSKQFDSILHPLYPEQSFTPVQRQIKSCSPKSYQTMSRILWMNFNGNFSRVIKEQCFNYSVICVGDTRNTVEL